MSYAEVEMKVIQWSEARKIIPNSTPIAQWKKAAEELDELRDARLAPIVDFKGRAGKAEQGAA